MSAAGRKRLSETAQATLGGREDGAAEVEGGIAVPLFERMSVNQTFFRRTVRSVAEGAQAWAHERCWAEEAFTADEAALGEREDEKAGQGEGGVEATRDEVFEAVLPA